MRTLTRSSASDKNEVHTSGKGGPPNANSAINIRGWSVKHLFMALCFAYALCYMAEHLSSDEPTGCAFECCVVVAAACVHFLFQALEKRTPARPKLADTGSAQKCAEEPLDVQNQCKLQEVFLQALAEAYQVGPCSQNMHNALKVQFADLYEARRSQEYPVASETARAVIDTCLQASDAHRAADWLKVMANIGCNPGPGMVHLALKALIGAGEPAAAEELLAECLGAVGPDVGCYQLLFEQCLSCDDTPRVEAWLQRLMQHTRQEQAVCCQTLLRACMQVGVDQAEFWMHRMLKMGIELDLMICNAMLFVCGRAGDIVRAELWLQRMFEAEPTIVPDVSSYAAIVDACAQQCNPTRAQEWFDHMIASGLKSDVFTYQTLIKAYARLGDAVGAERCVVRAQQHGVQLQAFGYNAVIAAASKAGNPDMAQRWLHRLLEDGIEPNAMSFNCVIDALAKHGEAAKAQAVLQRMRAGAVKPDVVTIGMVLHACAKAGDARRAEAIFEEVMTSRDITPDGICYNAMIHAYVKAGDISRAEYWLVEMLDKGISPSVVSYTTVIHAHARNGSIAQAEGVLQRMLEGGVEANVVTFSALIQACSKTGDIDRAEKWFKVMCASGIKANDVIFSTMLNVFAKAGDFARAEEWLERMKQDGVSPNTVCYNNVIEACAKAGRLDRAENWLRRLTENREMQPTRKSYTIAAQGFSKAGRWQDTQRILQDMESAGINMDEFSLTVLLSAYNRGRPTQTQRAEEAFRNYVRKGLPLTAPPIRVLRNMLGNSRVKRLLEEERVSVPSE